MTTDSLRPGETFGNFRIARELGRGGMGVVYEAESLADGRVVALKLLLNGMDADDARQRFLREGRVASTLMHPNTVYVFGTQEIDGLPTIAMEYVAGGTLEDWVREKGPVSPADAIRMVGEVIDGLEAAHAGGILHRDIKPSNCFVAHDGSVKVGDFGLSRPSQGGEDMRITKTGMMLGTPAYAPAEQLLGEPLDVRSDIYSVGATLYFLLTGVLPFPGANPMVVLASVMQGAPTPPETHQPQIPKALSAIVLRAMARQSSERFANYAEFRAALDALQKIDAEPGRPLTRVMAFMLDVAIASSIDSRGSDLILGVSWDEQHQGWAMLISWCVFLCVRAIPEALWGTTPGKRVLGLRTQRRDGGSISLWVSLGRSTLTFPVEHASALFKLVFSITRVSDTLMLTLTTVTSLILLSTIRRRNGYAALHDRLFGTRVVIARRNASERRFAGGATRLIELPSSGERIGAFVIVAPAFIAPDGSWVYDAIDGSLGRPVWLHRVAPGVPARPLARRNLGRPARMRWVAGRRDDSQPFDVYGTPDGQRLIDLAATVSWAVCRGWLEDLAGEIIAAEEGGEILRPALDEIWVSAGQQAMIMDLALVPRSDTIGSPSAGAILYAVARFALCGTSASASSPWPALPRSVRAWLDALPQQVDLRSSRASIAHIRETAGHITRAQRVRVAVVIGVVTSLITLAGASSYASSQRPLQQSLGPLIEFTVSATNHSDARADTNVPRRDTFEAFPAKISRWGSARHAAQHDTIDARLKIVTQYLATTHGAVLRNPSRRRTLVGDALPWAALDSVFQELGTVPAADSMRAHHMVEQNWHGSLPERDSHIVQLISLGIVCLHSLLLGTGLCAGLFALFTRRGPLMRSVGFEVVDRTGQPATRLRLLARAAGSWAVLIPLPTLVAAIVMDQILKPRSAAENVPYPFLWLGLSSGISLALGSLVLWYGFRHPSRGMGDRIAGTTTVHE